MADVTQGARSERELVAFMELSDHFEASNPIHTAAGGKEYGFRDALVPGVTVFGWTVPQLIDVLGEGWVDHGWAEFGLYSPSYPGDRLRIAAEAADDGTCTFLVENDGRSALTGTAGVGDAPWLGELSRPERVAPADPVADPPPLTLDNAPIGKDLPPLAIDVTADDARRAAVGTFATDHPLFTGARPRIHPASHLNLTGLVKRAYAFAPSIHTRTRLQRVRPAYAGQQITMAARAVEAFARRAHQYIVVDGVMLGADGQDLARIRHTVIFSVAKREASAG